jgi:hypothetical protein
MRASYCAKTIIKDKNFSLTLHFSPVLDRCGMFRLILIKPFSGLAPQEYIKDYLDFTHTLRTVLSDANLLQSLC